MDRQAVTHCNKRTRLQSFNQSGVISTPSTTTCSTRFWLGFPPSASTPTLERGILHLVHTVSAEDDAKIRCSELPNEQPHLCTYPNFGRIVDFLLQGEQLLPVEYSSFVFRLTSFLSTKELSQLALQENEPRVVMLAFCFPSCGYERSNLHSRVATAEFLLNFWTHWICLSWTDSDRVILQQETDTILCPRLSTSCLLATCWS